MLSALGGHPIGFVVESWTVNLSLAVDNLLSSLWIGLLWRLVRSLSDDGTLGGGYILRGSVVQASLMETE